MVNFSLAGGYTYTQESERALTSHLTIDHKTGPLGIIGPSGCGKSSLVSQLVAVPGVTLAPTWTDRPRRAGENELEHRFVDAETFEDMLAAGRFREVVQPFGLAYRYGLPAFEVDDDLSVVMLRAAFVGMFKHYYPTSVIYQIEAPYAQAHQAVIERGGEAGTRLKDFKTEREAGRACADRVFVNNGTLDKVWEEVREALFRDGLLKP